MPANQHLTNLLQLLHLPEVLNLHNDNKRSVSSIGIFCKQGWEGHSVHYISKNVYRSMAKCKQNTFTIA